MLTFIDPVRESDNFNTWKIIVCFKYRKFQKKYFIEECKMFLL